MLENKNNIYFIGINGIGMSALAQMLVNKGYTVSGSDINYTYISKKMEEQGIKVNIGQVVENVKDKDIDLVIYSTAIKETNEEYVYAKENNISMMRRGKLLAEIMNVYKKSIAVAGTHGKTTTSSMTSVAFLEEDPNILVGGIIPEIASNSRIGNTEYFIVEADESDNSFLYLQPTYSIITNIEEDHLEHHGSLENIRKSFIKFISQTKEKVILCYDAENVRHLNISDEDKDKLVWYTIDIDNVDEKDREKIDIYANNIHIINGCTHFDVILNGENLGEYILSIPGMHNVSNALSVIYIGRYNKIDNEILKEKIYKFKGANRRYQILYKDENIKIIDDYAHHPTEIKATIDAAKNNETGETTIIFQPHRYTRTDYFYDDFVKILAKADNLILMPIYSASEDNINNISSNNLAMDISKITGKEVNVYEYEDIYKYISDNKNIKQNYIFMGAGSISKYAHDIVDSI